MSDNRLPIDDPRLTAYALGELDPTEAAEFEQSLELSPESRGAVEEIRELASLLQGELRQEQAPALRAEQRAAILQAAEVGHRNGELRTDPASSSAEAVVDEKSRPPASAVGGGFTTGRWGRRFASLMTVAAMIMVALLLIPVQHPARSTALNDRYFNGLDMDADGVDQLASEAQTWDRPTRKSSANLHRFSAPDNSVAANGWADRQEDRVELYADGPVDGTRPRRSSGKYNLMRDELQSFDESAPAAARGLNRELTEFRSKQRASDPQGGAAPLAAPVSGPGAAGEPSSSGSGQAVADQRKTSDFVGVPGGNGKESAAVEFKEKESPDLAASKLRSHTLAGVPVNKLKSPARVNKPMASDPTDRVALESAVPRAEESRGGALGGGVGELSPTASPAAGAAGSTEKSRLAQKSDSMFRRRAGSPSGRPDSDAAPVSEGAETEARPFHAAKAPALAKKLAPTTSSSTQNESKRESRPEVAQRGYSSGENQKGGEARMQFGAAGNSRSIAVDQKDGAAGMSIASTPAQPLNESLSELGDLKTGKSGDDSMSLDNLAEGQQVSEAARQKKELLAGDSLGVVAGLTNTVTLNLERAPLQDVVKQVAEQGKFLYDIDAEGLTQQGVSPQTPVTFNVEAVPADVALQQLLSPLALNFAVRGEVIRITNRAQLVEGEQVPGTEEYDPIIENPFVAPLSAPLSTFSIDVDTASYANIRRFITQHQLPPRNAVRVEELVNYFAYDYPQPVENRPIAVNVDVGQSPWRPEHRLVRIGLKAREIPRDRRPASNLVFLVDVSGSMSSENKLPLVKRGLTLLTEQMTEGDRVAIVTYSDSALVRLNSTTGDNRQPILETINSLQAAGSTNGAGGIQLAYRTAIEHFVDGGTNRVILCTDGDFNVGVSDDDELVKLIQDRARSKVFFSVFGFGMGNLKDGKLEKLADKGNGHYAYIDGQREAQKVFVEELAATLVTVAKDVKLQVEFNPARVGAYRLIGYENRALATPDFHDDRKDAGEMGAGHTVTALYEIAPADRFPPPPAGEALRYQRIGLAQAGEVGKELLSVRVRYKMPEADESALFEVPVIDPLPLATIDDLDRKDGNAPSTPRPPRDFDWAAAVAAYGMILRDSQYRGQAGLDMVLELAQGAKGEDPTGRRQEFIDLVQQTKSIRPSLASSEVLTRSTIAPVVLTPQQAEERATVNGKYRNLLRIIPADGDMAGYGAFHDYGRWDETSYLGHDNLPKGYWVYVAPNWYIWGDALTESEVRK